MVRENLSTEMCHLYREVGIFGVEQSVRGVVNRIKRLNPRQSTPCTSGAHPKKDQHDSSAVVRREELTGEDRERSRMDRGLRGLSWDFF